MVKLWYMLSIVVVMFFEPLSNELDSNTQYAHVETEDTFTGLSFDIHSVYKPNLANKLNPFSYRAPATLLAGTGGFFFGVAAIEMLEMGTPVPVIISVIVLLLMSSACKEKEQTIIEKYFKAMKSYSSSPFFVVYIWFQVSL